MSSFITEPLPFNEKSPTTPAPWGLSHPCEQELPCVGLAESCRFSLFVKELPVGTHSQHLNSLVLGRIADDLAQLAPFANIGNHFGDHVLGIEKNAVCFRTIHDAETASLLCHALFVGDHRYVVHALSFPPLTLPRPSIRKCSSQPIPRPSHRPPSLPPGFWRATVPFSRTSL